MKSCKNCQQPVEDNAEFCPHCGAALVSLDPYDHTREYDPQDIAKHKLYAMAVYLLGFLGLLLAHLVKEDSPYLEFHKRQALRMLLVEVLLCCVILFLLWTILLPMMAGVFLGVSLVLRFICFAQVGMGQAKEAVLIRSIKFLQ